MRNLGRPPTGAAGGANGGADAVPGALTVGGAAAANQEMKGANEVADESLAAEDAVTACTIYGRNNPCAHLAGSAPGAQYRGGAHSAIQLP